MLRQSLDILALAEPLDIADVIMRIALFVIALRIIIG
jgi:hypothetical protein